MATKKSDSQSAPAVRICRNCFAAFSATKSACIFCGERLKVNPRKIPEVDGELVEFQRAQKRIEQGSARSLAELIELGKQRGFKPGWAIKVYEARTKKRTL